MTQQYFEARPASDHQYDRYQAQVGQHRLHLLTDSGVFSRHQLDYGSKLLVESFLDQARIDRSSKLLELGAGYGPILIAIAKHFPDWAYTGIEINERAYQLAQENASSNQVDEAIDWRLGDATQRIEDLTDQYDFVLTNPPIRAGKAIIQTFVKRAFDYLRPGGQLWLVIQKKQGAPSMKKHMDQVFGNVDRVALDKGYWILRSNKESD